MPPLRSDTSVPPRAFTPTNGGEPAAPDHAAGDARTTFLSLLVLAVVLAVGGVVLFWFNPAEHGFFPQCILYRATGLQCPGCGGLRATHQLLHGHLAEAFRFNALFVCLLPLGAWYGVDRWRVSSGRRSCWPFRNGRWLTIFLSIAAFTLGRNLPQLSDRISSWFSPATNTDPATRDAPVRQ